MPNTIKPSEKTIQALLINFAMNHAGHKMALPNPTPTGAVNVLKWEADLLTINASGYSHEYEIKLSKADYMRDRRKEEKHTCLLSSYETYCRNKNWIENQNQNYFYYVTYQFEIDPPAWAGWVYVEEKKYHDQSRLRMEIKHKAPKLHAGKMGERQIEHIAHLLSYRLENAYRRLYPYFLYDEAPYITESEIESRLEAVGESKISFPLAK
jgi:hypothetical protein